MFIKGNFRRKPIIIASLLLVIILLIKFATFYPAWIEAKYSTGIYPLISEFYREVFGRIGISLGDILYLFAGTCLVVFIIKFIRIVVRRRLRKVDYKNKLVKAFIICEVVYILFNLSWGLNYNRLGIAYQLKLDATEHSIKDLKTITTLLVAKVNHDRLALGNGRIAYPPYAIVFNEAQRAYQNASGEYPFLSYKVLSVKRSLYGRLGNFLGFLGYYNPFTGEAQLNLTQPRFLIPFVTCHEMAHQLGYASESEASFVGYITAMASPDTLFHYSTYFDLFSYANHELYLRDSVTAKENYKHLDTLVKIDVIELREYWRKSDNIVEPFIRVFYDQYLKANQQDEGIKSYNEVVSWLIAYHKKYNRL